MLGSKYMRDDNMRSMSDLFISEISEMEKKVIISLAKSGPKSGYDFHLGGKKKRGNRQAIMSSSTWQDIRKNLGPKGKDLIASVKIKKSSSHDERGRRKDLCWLTDRGIGIALACHADPNTLFEHAKRVYPQNEELLFAIDVARLVGKDIVDASYLLCSGRSSEVNPEFMLSMLSMDQKKRNQHLKKFAGLVKKYPAIRKKFNPRKLGKLVSKVRDSLDLFEKAWQGEEY